MIDHKATYGGTTDQLPGIDAPGSPVHWAVVTFAGSTVATFFGPTEESATDDATTWAALLNGKVQLVKNTG